MKKTIFLSAILVLIFSLLLAFTFLARYKAENTNFKKQQFKDSVTMSILNKTILLNADAITLNVDKKTLVTDSNNKTILLSKLVTDEKICYRFSENNCMLCVEKYIPYLNYFVQKYGRHRVLILGSFSTPSNLWLTLKKYNLANIDVYNLPFSYLENEKIEQINEPYVFVLNPSLEASNVFIPQKDVPRLSALYQNNTFLSHSH